MVFVDLLIGVLFAVAPMEAIPRQAAVVNDSAYVDVDRRAVYFSPSCAELINDVFREQCASEAMNEAIATQLRYPTDVAIEGEAVVAAVVEKDGSLSNLQLVADPGQGLGTEVLRVLRLLGEAGSWVPAVVDDREVRSRLRVSIPLDPTAAPATPTPPAPEERIYKVVSHMPIMWHPECDQAVDYVDQKRCADQKMLDFIYEHLQYPEAALQSKVQGMAIISFIVEKDGRLTEPTIVRDPGNGTGEEALRIVRRMADTADWVAGGQDGRAVRVLFNLPVKFALD